MLMLVVPGAALACAEKFATIAPLPFTDEGLKFA
jgi:hypothetical protein